MPARKVGQQLADRRAARAGLLSQPSVARGCSMASPLATTSIASGNWAAHVSVMGHHVMGLMRDAQQQLMVDAQAGSANVENRPRHLL